MSSEQISAPRPKRVRWPIIVIVAVLLTAATVIWINVLQPLPAEAAGCNEPGVVSPLDDAATDDIATPVTTATATEEAPDTDNSASSVEISTTLGQFVDPHTLADTRPADPSRVPVRVLNASSVRGQAKTVTDELRNAGFTAIAKQDNDPLYPLWDLRCYGEIRYGFAGQAEARTVLMVAPCAQLVLDDRVDNSVDLSLGKRYFLETVSDEIREQLIDIKNASAPPPVIEGQTVSVRALPDIPPLPDRTHCPD